MRQFKHKTYCILCHQVGPTSPLLISVHNNLFTCHASIGQTHIHICIPSVRQMNSESSSFCFVGIRKHFWESKAITNKVPHYLCFWATLFTNAKDIFGPQNSYYPSKFKTILKKSQNKPAFLVDGSYMAITWLTNYSIFSTFFVVTHNPQLLM